MRLSREIAFLHICIHRFDQVDSIIDILCKYRPQKLVLVENYETLTKLPRAAMSSEIISPTRLREFKRKYVTSLSWSQLSDAWPSHYRCSRNKATCYSFKFVSLRLVHDSMVIVKLKHPPRNS